MVEKMLKYRRIKSTIGRKTTKSDVVEGKKMTYAEFFAEIKGRFMEADVSDIREHLAYQFNITGEASGIFYVEVKDGKLSVEPYEYFDRDAMFICSAKTLRELADGTLDPVLAFTVQKLKVEGNIDKALRFKELAERSRG
jgi:putative sterol carrier protein